MGLVKTLILALFFIGVIIMVLGALCLTIWGIIISFQASIIVGIISIMVAPMSCVAGFLDVFLDVNLPILMVEFLNAHTNKPIP